MTLSTIILFFCFTQIWAHIVPRIVEGEPVSSGQYPFAAAVYYTTNDGTFLCGGSILSDKWILTAAQCLRGANEVIIVLGVTDLSQGGTSGSILRSTEYVIHPENNPGTLDNDIGLVSISSTISFNERIQPIKLPSETLGPYEDTLVLGWGTTGDESAPSLNQLISVNLTTISNAICRRTYGEYVKDNMVCASGDGNHGICEGDSGGPLVTVTPDGETVQVGVATFYSAAGCETNHPSGFTRVFEYGEWIKNITGIIDEPEEPVEESTEEPIDDPTGEATDEPTEEPTDKPTEEPTDKPTEEPTEAPTEEPTDEPTEEPTDEPTEEPTDEPTEEPTDEPTEEPTDEPTKEPTDEPTQEPTNEPTEKPTDEPTEKPTNEPTEKPTDEPTNEPTEGPTDKPTEEPTDEPTEEPTDEPTEEPTNEPTEEPTNEPTEELTNEPTEESTIETTEDPTAAPTQKPTNEPTDEPPLQPPEDNNSSGLTTVNFFFLIISLFIMLIRNI